MNSLNNILKGFECLNIKLIEKELVNYETISRVYTAVFINTVRDIFDNVINFWSSDIDFKAIELFRDKENERLFIFVNSKGISYLSLNFFLMTRTQL